ncbi:hypothetical protein ACSTLM_20115 [Vibrio parahaemolyticus]
MYKRLALLLLAFSLVLLVVFQNFRIDPIMYGDRKLAARINHLKILDSQLAQGLTPENADIAVGISEPGLSAALASLVGVKAQSTDIDGVELEVVSARAHLEPGMLRLSLGIAARLEQVGNVEFTASGLLLLKSISHQAATYQPLLSSIEAKVKTGMFSFQTRTWVSGLLASHLVQDFAEDLRFELPLAHQAIQNMGVDKVERTDVVNDKHGHIGHYVTHTHLARSILLADETLRVLPPVVTGEAVWVLGIIQQTEPVEAKMPVESTPSLDELERLQQRIAEYVQTFASPIADLELRLNQTLIDHALRAFNALPQEKRRVLSKLTEREGHFAKDYDEADIVGEGGYYADFQDHNSARAQLDLLPIKTTWNDNGAQFDTELSVSASADLKVHLDPYVGGGFSTKFRIEGKTQVPLSMRLETRQLRLNDGSTVAVMGPVIECRDFPVTLSGGGDIKFGVTMHELVGEEQAEPYVLLSSARVYPSQLLEAIDDGPLRHDEYWSEVILLPTLSKASAQGYRVFANVSATLHHGPREETKRENEAPVLPEGFVTSWKQQVQGKCPTPKGMIVHFAGEDFGPNNEIVKAVKVLAASVDRTNKNIEISIDRVNTVIRDPSKTPEVLGDVLGDFGDAIEGVVEDIGDLLGL